MPLVPKARVTMAAICARVRFSPAAIFPSMPLSSPLLMAFCNACVDQSLGISGKVVLSAAKAGLGIIDAVMAALTTKDNICFFICFFIGVASDYDVLGVLGHTFLKHRKGIITSFFDIFFSYIILF